MHFAIDSLRFPFIMLAICISMASWANTVDYSENDTVYLAPDTIRRIVIDTVYEYEDDETTTPKIVTKKDQSILIGTIAGFECNYFYPLYKKISPTLGLGLSGCFTYNKWFIDADIFVSGIQSISPNYTKHFSTDVSWTDSTKTLIDNFYQIINNDTIYTPIYRTNYIIQSKRIESDTMYSTGNRYISLSLPITLGYCIKKRKTWIGFGGGTQFRYIAAWKSNKVIINNSFEDESAFFRSFAIGVQAKCFLKQKITRKWWLTTALSGSIPIYSQYNSTAGTLRVINWNITIGLQYFFRITYKEASDAKHF